MTRRGRDRERGAGSVLALVVVGVLLAAAWAALVLAAGLVARHRAAAAADLAALAALSRPTGAAAAATADCSRAASIAAAQGARLESCVTAGTEVVVDVRVELPAFVAAVLPDPVRRARAGPATPDSVR